MCRVAHALGEKMNPTPGLSIVPNAIVRVPSKRQEIAHPIGGAMPSPHVPCLDPYRIGPALLRNYAHTQCSNCWQGGFIEIICRDERSHSFVTSGLEVTDVFCDLGSSEPQQRDQKWSVGDSQHSRDRLYARKRNKDWLLQMDPLKVNGHGPTKLSSVSSIVDCIHTGLSLNAFKNRDLVDNGSLSKVWNFSNFLLDTANSRQVSDINTAK